MFSKKNYTRTSRALQDGLRDSVQCGLWMLRVGCAFTTSLHLAPSSNETISLRTKKALQDLRGFLRLSR